jgi:hypothetical protein
MIDVRVLRTAGLTDSQIVAVIAEDQAKRREQNRINKRNQRSRHHDIDDRADRCDPSPPPSSPPLTLSPITTSSPSLSPRLPFSLSLEASSEERSSGRGWPFEEFWAQYPHKIGKAAAKVAFDKVRRSTLVSFPEVIAGLMRYSAKTDDRPWCNPATWLNQARWADEPAKGNRNGQHRETLSERCVRLAAEARRREREAGLGGETDPFRGD